MFSVLISRFSSTPTTVNQILPALIFLPRACSPAKNRFSISAGAFLQDKTLKIAVNGQDVIADREIDFGDRWKFDTSDLNLAAEFQWRFGEQWSLRTQYFGSCAVRRATLDEDVGWGDYVVKAGTNAGAGVDVDVARMFFGRTFSEGANHEFGAGLGFHWMQIGAFIDGELFLNGESTGVRRESVSASAPLPNLGAWYDYAFNSEWLAGVRFDWLDVSFDEYSGNLLNSSVSISYVPWDHFGVTLAYQYFGIDVDVDKDSWNGGVDFSYRGPFLSVTATW